MNMTHTTTDAAEALPCPFCGNLNPDIEGNFAYGWAERHPDPDNDANHTNWIVSCLQDEGCPIVGVEFEGATRAEAIAAWNTRAPADLRSALEAETIREAAEYASELREIAGMLAQSPDGPLRWKQYRLVAVADFLNALTALAPTKGDVS